MRADCPSCAKFGLYKKNYSGAGEEKTSRSHRRMASGRRAGPQVMREYEILADHGIVRRWFKDDVLDLVLWHAPEGLRFQRF